MNTYKGRQALQYENESEQKQEFSVEIYTAQTPITVQLPNDISGNWAGYVEDAWMFTNFDMNGDTPTLPLFGFKTARISIKVNLPINNYSPTGAPLNYIGQMTAGGFEAGDSARLNQVRVNVNYSLVKDSYVQNMEFRGNTTLQFNLYDDEDREIIMTPFSNASKIFINGIEGAATKLFIRLKFFCVN